jgi:hypothetical protein
MNHDVFIVKRDKMKFIIKDKHKNKQYIQVEFIIYTKFKIYQS